MYCQTGNNRKHSILIWAFLAVLYCGGVYAQDKNGEPPVIGPTLSYADQECDTVTISFYTPRQEKSGVYIRYQNNFIMKIDDNSRNWHHFTVKFQKNRPFTYEIMSEDPRLHRITGTITPPAGKPYRFIMIGDTLDSRPASPYPVFSSLARAATASRPAFLVHLGDIVSVPNDLYEWSRFFNAGGALTRNTPILPALGNHDQFSPLFRKFFSLPDLRYPFYSYSMPRLKVIVLDTATYFGPDSIQYRWLERELASTVRFKIVIMHVPPMSANALHTAIENQAAQNILVPLFRKHGVQAVFSGHEHLYERLRAEGIYYITSGGGAPEQDDTREENEYREKLISGQPHFIEAAVYENRMDFRVFNTNGALLDNFQISRLSNL